MATTPDLFNIQKLEEFKLSAQNARAKSAKSDPKLSQTDLQLPLWMHSLDTGGIMLKLYDHRLSEHEKKLLRQENGADDQIIRSYFALLGLLHDVGKLCFSFQQKVFRNAVDKETAPFPITEGNWDGLHHTLATEPILIRLGYSENLISVLDSHHGKLQEFTQTIRGSRGKIMSRREDSYHDTLFGNRKKELLNLWQNFIQQALSLAGFNSIEEIPKFSQSALLVLAGYLIEADWISSNTDFFPLLKPEDPGDITTYPRRIEQGWKALKLPEKWISPASRKFVEEFGFSPRPFQEDVITIANNIQTPGLMILEAPMGVGKTEAALATAQIFAYKNGSSGIFFGLPTMATANGLYPRFEHWALLHNGGHPLSMKLFHSKAAYNPLFSALPSRTDGAEDYSLFIHEWMSGKKGLFNDFVIGTIDQALMAVLCHKHFMMRFAGLAGKVVILDEVHAYDTYMSQFFERMLQWLGALQVPTILLSATLSSEKRRKFLGAYLGDNKLTNLEIDNTCSYPSISWTDDKSLGIQSSSASDHQFIQVIKNQWQSEETPNKIASLLQEKLQQGGCAGVIVNTVAASQTLAAYLKERFPNFTVILAHSRFTTADRSQIEQEVEKHVGKDSTADIRNKVIVVGTQVLEQSLDIDFDLLISELAPIDLIFQRSGRLHRHKRNSRPLSLQIPKLYIFTTPNINEDNFESPIYEPWIQKRSWTNLPESITLPEDIPGLVNIVYESKEKLDQTEKNDRLYQNMQLNKDAKERKARFFLLDKPVFDDVDDKEKETGIHGLFPLKRFEQNLEEAEASVRDCSPSIECYLIKEGQDPYKTINNTCSIQIPLKNDDINYFKKSVQDHMKEKFSSLSQEQLLGLPLTLVLDNEGTATLANTLYTYTPFMGLKIQLK